MVRYAAHTTPMRYLLLLFIATFSSFMRPPLGSAEELVSIRLVNYIGESKELNLYLTGNFLSSDPTIRLTEGVKYHLTSHEGSLLIEADGMTQEFKTPFVLRQPPCDPH